MPRIIEYEGRRIEVPDDADDAFIADVLAAQPAAPAAPPPSQVPTAPEDVPGATGVPGGPTAQAAPAETPADERSWLDAIMSGLDYVDNTGAIGVAGARKGISGVLGLPVDLVNAAPMLANLIPGVDGVGPISQNPVGGSRFIDAILGAPADAAAYAYNEGAAALGSDSRVAGAEGPQPQDMLQRGVRRVGQEMGAAAVPVGAALNTAARVGVEGARQLPALVRMFVEPAAVNPQRFVSKEMAVAAGAGGGASAANELTGNRNGENPWIDAGGAIAGALGTGVGSALVRSTTDIGRALFGNGSYADEVVREAVMRKIADSAGISAPPGAEPDLTPIINQIEQSPRVSDVVPGFRESLADRTKNPGLAALEYSRQGGPNAGSYTQRRAENTAAIDRAVDEAAPDPNATPGQFRDELELERTRRLEDAGVQTANAQDAYGRAVEGLRPLMTGEGRGANIRTALEDASEAARRMLSEAWRPINESAQQVDVAPLNQRFAGVTEAQPLANQRYVPNEAAIPERLIEAETPPQPTGLLDASGSPIMRAGQPGSTQAPLNEITALRSTLTDELRNPATTPKERRVIEQYVSQLDDYMAQNLPDDLRRQYEAARAATVDFNDRFTRPQSAIGQVLDTREGQPRYPDSTVAQRFVQTDQGRIADFEALMREAGNDSRVQSAVRDQILSDVRDRGLLENAQGLNDYLGQYGRVFERFPQLREELGTAGNLRRQLAEAQTAEQNLRDTLTRQGRSAVANYLSYSNEKAAQAMKGVLASRDPRAAADELLTFVGDDKKAVEGARKVFWDLLQEKSRAGGRTTANIDGRQPWSPAALNEFLDNPANAAVAERLWRDNPEHLQRIREIAEAIKGVDVRNAAKAPNTSGTPQGSFSQLLSPETLQSRFYAYRSGKISGSFLATALVSTLVRRGVRKAQEEGFQRMLDDVIQDADTAALLMRENNPADRAALAKKAKLWFGNEASSIVNSMSADDEDETTGAVMSGGR
jgi:hypothetical protein